MNGEKAKTINRHIREVLIENRSKHSFPYYKYRRINFMNCHHIKLHLSFSPSCCAFHSCDGARKLYSLSGDIFFRFSVQFELTENVLLQSCLCHTHKFEQKIQMIKLNSDFSCTIHGVLHNFHCEWKTKQNTREQMWR